ncbi:MAG TPA: SagB/ThcOx family dehydrogenase [Paludibacteraceae bacterium]|jgi:hypothetical protein|nr:SagB/ThcOx family dehydrogenase [Paludibacteraceae bacterium]HOU67399.1 SagB/ThcOx family dehydrogenase [Paludibacteraceae bacterium]HPH62265.1 SagB/ThcOx family dehydrogenase [Paludibacteraceae bacterium]HQF49545.1 SagB/ThcOx family dehydrogenase [Paludibacteraceae bacterium]HQJ89298.1 SagB/ThcOx family dehydrogenase [Paludibacteraceae bacterium]
MANKGNLAYQIVLIVLLAVIFFLIWQNRNSVSTASQESEPVVTQEQEEAPTYVLSTSAQDSFALPSPEMKGGMPLQEALKNRKTDRSFSDKSLSDQQISNLLWSANGVNRQDDQKRTAPSARNCQEIDVYLFTKAAVYKYDPINNALLLVKAGDHREKAGMNDFFKVAPVSFVYVADFAKMKDYDESGRDFYSATDVGFVSQNVYLHCASENMSTVVCGYVSREDLMKLLNISNCRVLLSQPIGLSK